MQKRSNSGWVGWLWWLGDGHGGDDLAWLLGPQWSHIWYLAVLDSPPPVEPSRS